MSFAPLEKKTLPSQLQPTNQSPAPKPKQSLAPLKRASAPMMAPATISAADIHNDYIRHGGTCKQDPSAAGCFLDSSQRLLLVNGYQQRVLAAQLQYQLALEELRVDKLIEKEVDLSWVVTFILDLAGLNSIAAIGHAAKWLRDVPAANAVWALKAAAVELESTSIVTQAAEMIEGVSDRSLDSVVRAAVNEGKKQAVTSMKKTARAQSSEKELAVSYLDRLKDQAATLYEHLREDPPATVSDAELVALYQSFKADMGHTIGAYKEQLKAKINRYEGTRIGDLGRSERMHLTPLHEEDAATADAVKTPDDSNRFQEDHGAWAWPATREMKVAWVGYSSSPKRTLMYVRQDFELSMSRFAEDLSQPIQSQPMERRHQLEPVEDEFIEVAIERHKAAWGHDPDVIVNDDLAWLASLKGSRR